MVVESGMNIWGEFATYGGDQIESTPTLEGAVMAVHRKKSFIGTVCPWFMLEAWVSFIVALTTLSGCGVGETLETGMGGNPGKQISTEVALGSVVAVSLSASNCTDPTQCKSGFCVDGVCCNAACAGSCQACTATKKGGGVDGICGNIGNGLDPDGECANGCDGQGACFGTAGAACAKGSSCASGICQNGVCCLSACAPVDECHVATCAAGTGECVQMARADESLCNDADACTVGDSCQQGVCVAGASLVCPGTMTCSYGTCISSCVQRLGNISDFHELPTSGPNGAVADFNGDGVADLAMSNAANATVSVYLNGGDGVVFSGPFDYATGTNPGKIIVADYNGDGAPDMLVKSAGAVSVLMNNGTGSFGPKVDTAGVDPSIADDFNGDGRADVAGYGSTNLYVWLNAGNGTFLPAVGYNVGAFGIPYKIAAGDFNGDGHTDLATAVDPGFYDSIRMLMNNGNGTFGASFSVGTMANSDDYALGMFAADWNGDGADDLAVGSDATSRVLTWTSNGMGGGVWGYVSIGTNASEFAAADMNGDGLLDLAFTVPSLNLVTVLLNNGNGTWNSIDADAHGYPRAINLADLNGDGSPDLIMSTQHVLFNNGDGHFGDVVSYGPTSSGRQIIAADLNADGLQDVAVANYTSAKVGVMMNMGNGGLAPMVNYATRNGPVALVAADLNGDGAQDLVTANYAANPGTVSVLLNNGGGTFAPKVDFTVGDYLHSIVAADMNGDGFLDLALTSAAYQQSYVLRNLGNGTFASAVAYDTWTTNTKSIVAADLNGDGFKDLAVAGWGSDLLGILMNLGNGTFAPVVHYSAPGGPSSIGAADLTGDGSLDLVVSAFYGNAVLVFRNLGNGTFAAPITYPGSTRPTWVTTADVNADGLVDVGVANWVAASASVFLNMGNGILAPRADYVTDKGCYSIAAADLDNDGFIDLAVSNDRSQTVSLLFNTCVP